MTNNLVDEYRVSAYDRAVELTSQYPWFVKNQDDIFKLAERIYNFYILPEKNNEE